MTLTSKQAAFIQRMTESVENEQWGYELLLKRPNFADFFDDLRQAGLFEAARNSGPVPGTQPNSLRIPYWPALDYLLACAKLSGSSVDLRLADKVLSVVRVVSASRDVHGEHPDNYHTHRVFAEVIGAVPLPAIRDEDLDLIPVWLSSRFDTGLVTRALDSGLLRRLLESSSGRDASRACRVLRHCTAIRWVEDTKRREGAMTPVTAAEDYWLDELLQHHANSFGSKAGREASELLLDRVREVFGGSATPGMSWLVRPAVETHEQNHRWEGAANTVVSGARDVLLAWVAQDPAGAQPFVSGLLSDGSDIVRRIALYVSNQRWDVLARAFIERISPELFDIRHVHELYGVLRDRFSTFAPADRSRTTDAIRSIPAPSTGEDPERRLKFMQKRWLSAIAGKGDPSADTWFAELSADGSLGLPEHPDFLSFIEMRWGPGPSAYRPEELAAFARDGTLVNRLNDFRDTGAWRAPTMSALVDTLEAAVALEPQAFADVLPSFREGPDR